MHREVFSIYIKQANTNFYLAKFYILSYIYNKVQYLTNTYIHIYVYFQVEIASSCLLRPEAPD